MLIISLQFAGRSVCLKLHSATANQHDVPETDTGGRVGDRSYSAMCPGTNTNM